MSNWALLATVGVLGWSLAALLVAQHPRVLLGLLAVQYGAAAGVLNALLAPDWTVAGVPVSTAAVVDLVLGLTVTGVLGATLWRLRPAVLRTLRATPAD